MRMRGAKLLLEHGYDVLEAETGEEAIEIYEKEKPDMVFMDVSLPGIDGIEAVRKIMAIDSSAKISMLSGMGQQSLIIESIKAGAKDFIVKPFDPAKILGVVDRVLGGA
jgi:two-component system, chemotaxis family, chemotaxis protein CheY